MSVEDADKKCLFDALQIFDFELSSSDVEAINKLNKDLRIGAPTKIRNGWAESTTMLLTIVISLMTVIIIILIDNW